MASHDATLNSPRCLIIVPAFNEAAAIAQLVTRIHQQQPDCDILVVDDGSFDATVRRVPAVATVVSLPFNLGIGGAMQTGYRYAQEHGYDLAVQVDGDGQHPPDQIARLIDRIRVGDVDLVIGSRFLDGGHYHQQLARLAGIKLLAGLLRLLVGRRFTDCTSGFRICNRRVIDAFAYWYPDDYPEPEVILLLHRAGYRIDETAIVMHQRTTGRTSIPLRRGLFYVAKVTMSLLLDMLRHPWPEKVLRT